MMRVILTKSGISGIGFFTRFLQLWPAKDRMPGISPTRRDSAQRDEEPVRTAQQVLGQLSPHTTLAFNVERSKNPSAKQLTNWRG
jgi:hypothetical protein